MCIVPVWQVELLSSVMYKLAMYVLFYRLGEGCSHVAAIMFKVECAVRLGYTSTTSQLCKWNKTFCSKVSINLIILINCVIIY